MVSRNRKMLKCSSGYVSVEGVYDSQDTLSAYILSKTISKLGCYDQPRSIQEFSMRSTLHTVRRLFEYESRPDDGTTHATVNSTGK